MDTDYNFVFRTIGSLTFGYIYAYYQSNKTPEVILSKPKGKKRLTFFSYLIIVLFITTLIYGNGISDILYFLLMVGVVALLDCGAVYFDRNVPDSNPRKSKSRFVK